ncbi:MAG: hypothetical protein R6U96_18530, partial [Promethearchaeia archaeon]
MKKKTKFLITFSLVLTMLNLFVLFDLRLQNPVNNEIIDQKDNKFNKSTPKDSLGTYPVIHEDEWLKDRSFEAPAAEWNNHSGESGDSSDVNASLTGDSGNYEVLGNNGTYEFNSDLSNKSSQWFTKKNPEVPSYPDTHEMNSTGACVSHFWDESANQSISVNWEQNLTSTVNMSDYTITSANIDAVVNGSVATDSGHYYDGVEAGNDLGDETDQYATGDYVRFYVLISDIEKDNVYEIAYNQTTKLGQDNPEIATIGDTHMIPVTEESLKFYLESVLSQDYRNFTLSVGMRIWCEDNYGVDYDWWKQLVINSVNLSFSYERKIDQQTTLSWQQTGNKLDSSYSINNATLNFKYKTDKAWPTASPNSELRTLINGSQYAQTLELSDAPSTFEYASSGGFDVTNLIKRDVNISLEMQLFLADDFLLDEKIAISIDDISLNISYTETKDETATDLSLFMDGEDKTQSKSIQTPINEKVNVSIYYNNNDSGEFIPNASVTLTGYGDDKTLKNDTDLEHYNITIDTADLGLGESYFSISASKYTYETQEIDFTIDVIKRNSFLDNTILNETEVTTIEAPWNEEFNITTSYNDTLTNNSIENANVKLTSSSWTKSFTYSGNGIYNFTLDTSSLKLGSNFLTISASDENHSRTSETINVIVDERETEFTELSLNGDNRTEERSISLSWNKSLSVGVVIRDKNTNESISGIDLELSNGDISVNLTQEDGNYTGTIAAGDLSVGTHALTISGTKENYTIDDLRITVNVDTRETYYDQLFLDEKDRTEEESINLYWNESLSVSVLVNDSLTNESITGIDLELSNGDISVTLDDDNDDGNYTGTVAAGELPVGTTRLTISGTKENYTINSLRITVNVNERKTNLIYKEPDTESYESNVTFDVRFEDRDNFPIDEATIRLSNESGSEYWSLSEDYTCTFDNGNYTLEFNSTIFGDEGIFPIYITANKTNYETSIERIFISIEARGSNFTLKVFDLDEENYVDKTDSPSIERDVNQTVDIRF